MCVHCYLCNLPAKCFDGNATRLCSSKTAHLYTAHASPVSPEGNAGVHLSRSGGHLKQSRFSALNPVNYRTWGLMKEHVYKTPVGDTSS